MRDPAQRGLDAAEHDRHALERLAAALRVDDGAAVRPLAAFAAGRIGVVAADAPVRGVAVHHGIHVAAGDAEEHLWLAERLERLGRMPVGLRDDADPESLRLEQPADDGHAKARMVDIGIARHQHDVAGIPAERVHLGAAHREERRRLARARLGHQGLFGGDDLGVHGAQA